MPTRPSELLKLCRRFRQTWRDATGVEVDREFHISGSSDARRLGRWRRGLCLLAGKKNHPRQQENRHQPMAQQQPHPPATHKTNRHCMRNSWCRRRPLCVAAHSHYPLEAARGNSHCGACGILACSPAAPLPPISKICSSEQVMPLAEDSVENTSTLPLLEKFVNVSVKARGGTIGCTDFLNNRLPPLPVISQARHVAAAVMPTSKLIVRVLFARLKRSPMPQPLRVRCCRRRFQPATAPRLNQARSRSGNCWRLAENIR